MKIVLAVIGLFVLGGIAFTLYGPSNDENIEAQAVTTEESEEILSVVDDGSYAVLIDDSSVFWAGKKPLIDGYINTGSMEVTSGSIEVEDGVITGDLTMDMDTLSVTDTPTKPGSEDSLEGHLKGERWFDVATYPEAKFVITEVTERPDTETAFMYDVKGDLTMKGQTHELAFPAKIYTDENGLAHTSADFEFDRTKWGITAGSGSFFDSLADNVIDDMVALRFELIAEER